MYYTYIYILFVFNFNKLILINFTVRWGGEGLKTNYYIIINIHFANCNPRSSINHIHRARIYRTGMHIHFALNEFITPSARSMVNSIRKMKLSKSNRIKVCFIKSRYLGKIEFPANAKSRPEREVDSSQRENYILCVHTYVPPLLDTTGYTGLLMYNYIMLAFEAKVLTVTLRGVVDSDWIH